MAWLFGKNKKPQGRKKAGRGEVLTDGGVGYTTCPYCFHVSAYAGSDGYGQCPRCGATFEIISGEFD